MQAYNELFSKVLTYISKQFSPATFSIWFKDLELEGLTDSYVFLSTEKYHQAEFIFHMYYKKLEEAVQKTLTMGQRCEIILFNREDHHDFFPLMQDFINKGVLPERAFSREKPAPEMQKEEPMSEEEKRNVPPPRGTVIRTEIPAVATPSGIIHEYTFDNFIKGKANEMALGACQAIAENPSEIWNPLFLYGPSGMGKTHLLYAISNKIIANNPNATVVYVQGEDFANELIDSLMQKKPMHFFRERYRKVDVLLVDDIQFIAGKESTQEEFFHTFNALYQQKKQIILTSDRPVRDLKHLDNRLRTRFESGLTVDIQPPELELRIAIVQQKVKELNFEMPEKVKVYIAENIRNSIRELEGAIKRMHGYVFLYGMTPDMELARRCIEDMLPKENPDTMVEKTFEAISRKYHVSVEEIKGKRRQANIVTARHVATYLLRQLTSLSSIEIARYFSQDHSSILSAVKNVENKMENDSEFESTVNDLLREIRD